MKPLRRESTRFLTLPLAALLAVPTQAAEEPPIAAAAEEIAQDPYAAILEAIGNGVNEAALFQQMMAQMRQVLLTESPDIAWIEQRVPGTLDKMLVAIGPPLQRHSRRLQADYRAQVTELLARSLTPLEATQAARFYASPLGQILLGKVQDNYSVTAMATMATSNGGGADITSSAVERDHRRTLAGTFQALTPEQLAQIERQVAGQTWPAKFTALRQQIIPLQVRIENAPMLPEDEAEMEAALKRIAEAAVAGLN